MPERAYVNVDLSEAEAFQRLQRLCSGAVAAWGRFLGLADEELAALPEAVRDGVTELRRTVAEYRGDEPPRPEPDPDREYGSVVIEWPAPIGEGPGGALPGWKASITDAETGQLIKTCTEVDVAIHAEPGAMITAWLTMFMDEAGEPVRDGKPVPSADGREILTGAFPFRVTEMRVAR